MEWPTFKLFLLFDLLVYIEVCLDAFFSSNAVYLGRLLFCTNRKPSFHKGGAVIGQVVLHSEPTNQDTVFLEVFQRRRFCCIVTSKLFVCSRKYLLILVVDSHVHIFFILLMLK